MKDTKNYQNNRQDEDIKDIRDHIRILNSEMGEVNIKLAKIAGVNRTYQIILPILTGLTGLLVSRLI